MEPEIRRFNADDEYFFDEGCHIVELSNHTDDPGLSVARARVEPGVTTEWHALSVTTERYVILEGEGCVEVGNLEPQTVAAGDVVIIPADCRQRISNGGTVDLIFLALCTPRFDRKNYRRIE